MNTTSEDRLVGSAFVVLLAAGCTCLGLGDAHDIFWLRAVGVSFLALAGLLAAIALLLPAVIFFAWLDWVGFLPISRFIGWVRRQRERADERAEVRAGAPLLIEEQYRLFVIRKVHVAKPGDLRRSVTRLVRKLRSLGGPAFALYGYNPAMRKCRVLPCGFSRVGTFLEHSEIAWNFGREPSDPTHELVFFSRFNGTHAVYLRIQFVANGIEATCPGLSVELRLTPAAAGGDDQSRAERVQQMFRLLVDTLAADHGHVEFPRWSEPELLAEVSGFSEALGCG